MIRGKDLDNMKEIIVEINNHQDKNDVIVCYELINYIMDSNLNSVEELRTREESNFNTDDINKRLDNCYTEYLMDRTHLEELDQNEIAELISYGDKFENSKTIEEKLVCIVRMYITLGWSMLFPYSTYKLILEDKFN